MSHTFYNSLDLTCKSPFGAVKAGQPVTFNLTVPEDLGYVDPHLVLTTAALPRAATRIPA